MEGALPVGANTRNVSAVGVSVLVVRVGGRSCALPLAAVLETMRPLPVEPLAEGPAAVLGMAVIRGRPLPVVDARRLFDAPHPPATRFVTVRLGDGSGQAALVVDAVEGVTELDAASLERLPPLLQDAEAAGVTAVAARDARLVALLDATRMMPPEALP